MQRYAQLFPVMEQVKPKKIVEVGTWNGDRAVQMITFASQFHPVEEIEYVGFDLFEDATDETDKEESNVKAHFSQDEVGEKIAKTGAQVSLIKGNTRETLPEAVMNGWTAPDFTFIDGGHSIETIKSDYECLKDSKVVVLDDYYEEHNGNKMDIERWGCNKLVDEIGGSILSIKDPVYVEGKQCGVVQMAVVPPMHTKQRLKIKTKNCVEDESILSNIRAALERGFERLVPAQQHNGIAVFCSGGPSLKMYLDDIKRLQQMGAYVFSVKSVHDTLIDYGIIPWGCVLLDPRGHVTESIENPHPEIRYFVASMCAPETWAQMDGLPKVWGYHAMVGAGEDKLPEMRGEMLVGGGCSAAIRGLTIAHTLGFRHFRLFGYDLNYNDGGGMMTGYSQDRVKVSIENGEVFLDEEGNFETDYEKLAQAQEFAQIMKMPDMHIEAYGPGIVPALALGRKAPPKLESIYG